MIGMNPSHLSAYLGGVKRLTIETLTRLLSGIQYECHSTIVLHQKLTGANVQDAEFTPLEALLQPEDQDMYSTDPSIH